MMRLQIQEESRGDLSAYASIPIAFDVVERLELEVEAAGLGGFRLRRCTLEAPYVKDYDALDGGPRRWPERFDLTHWRVLTAYADGQRVGGAAVVFAPSELVMLEGRGDLAVLWDIRVSPAQRGSGVGSALVAAAAARASARGCTQLKVETQNVNVPACTFYLRNGFTLGAINRYAYPALPDEVQLLWYKPLARDDHAGPG